MNLLLIIGLNVKSTLINWSKVHQAYFDVVQTYPQYSKKGLKVSGHIKSY